MTDATHPAGTGRILAIDYGTVRLGLAISDEGQQFASPYANYDRVNPRRDLHYLREVIEHEDVVLVVVGLPIHLDGRESEKSAESRRFASWIARELEIPVTLYDERFTSVEAEHQLSSAKLSRKRRKKRRDMLAAQLLLAAFLERGGVGSDLPPTSLDDQADETDR